MAADCDVTADPSDDPYSTAARDENGEPKKPATPKIPKIYFASRTHSQLKQVVAELKRSAYKPQMAILGGRDQYCINKAAKGSKAGVDAACEELVKDFGCRFKKKEGTSWVGIEVHDIEDFKRECTSAKTCPYFAAREMAKAADLVFCPYSYIIDPLIRGAVGIDLTDAIIIFDEAHNIEDVSREAGSMDMDLDALNDAINAFALAMQFSSGQEVYEPLHDALLPVRDWMERYVHDASRMKPDGANRHELMTGGAQMLAALEVMKLGPEDVTILGRLYGAAKAHEERATFATDGDAASVALPQGVKKPGVGGVAMGVVAQLLSVLSMLYATPEGPPGLGPPPRPNHHTYKLAVKRWLAQSSTDRRRNKRSRGAAADPDTTNRADGPSFAVQLCLWTMSPAVVFAPLAAKTHSVVLTSGTLSPLESFAGELGVAFPTRLEANHVIDMRRQVWPAVIPCCPSGSLLCATYSHTSQVRFQDELGGAVRALCGVIPDGVLLFLPSYGVMDVLVSRWQSTSTWESLQSVKEVVVEPRGSQKEFDERLETYYAAVKANRGGLFIAVCRGKASEGIDFKDRNARGVLLVGIPFPGARDSKVRIRIGRPPGREIGVLTQAGSPDSTPSHSDSEPETGPGTCDNHVMAKKAYNDELLKSFTNSRGAVAQGSGGGPGRGAGSHNAGGGGGGWCAANKGGRGGSGGGGGGSTQGGGGGSGSTQGGGGGSGGTQGGGGGGTQGGGGGGGSGHGRKVPEGPLSGDKWYQQQGFRALNQAVGRCIRHKLDWGAIVLLDERFREDRNQRGLSKWVRGNLMAFNAFEPALTSLRGFFKELEAHPPVAPPKPALPPTPADPDPLSDSSDPQLNLARLGPPQHHQGPQPLPSHPHPHQHPHQHQHQHPPVPNNHNWGAPLTPVNTTAGQHLKRERDATPPHAGGGAGGGAGGQSEGGITREGFGGGGTPEPGDRLEPAAAAWHHELQQRQHEQLQQRQHEQQRQQQQGVKEETGGGKGGGGWQGCSLHPGVTGSLLPEGKGAGVQHEKEPCGRCGSTAGNSTMLASEHHAQRRRLQHASGASGASGAQDWGSQGPHTGGAVRRRAVVGTGGGRQSKLDFSKAKTSATTTPTGSGLATPIASAHGSGPAGVGHDPPAGPTGPRPAAWTQGSGPTGGGWHVTGGTAASTPCGPSTSGPQGLSHQPVAWGPSQQQPGPWNQGPASSLAQSGARALAWGMPAGDAGVTPAVTLGRADQALGSDSGYGSVSIGRQLQYGTSQTQLSPVQLQLSGGRPQPSMGQPQPPVSQRLPGSSHPQRLTHPQQLASSAGRTHIKCEYEEQGAEQHTRHATGFASASNLAQQQQQQQQRRQEPWGSTQHMPRRQSQAGPAHSCHTPEHRPRQQQHQQGQQSQLQPHQNNTPNLHHNQQQNYHASPQQPAGGWQQQQQQQTSDQPNAGQQRNFAHHSPSSYTSPQQPPLQRQQQQQSAQQGFLQQQQQQQQQQLQHHDIPQHNASRQQHTQQRSVAAPASGSFSPPAPAPAAAAAAAAALPTPLPVILNSPGPLTPLLLQLQRVMGLALPLTPGQVSGWLEQDIARVCASLEQQFARDPALAAQHGIRQPSCVRRVAGNSLPEFFSWASECLQAPPPAPPPPPPPPPAPSWAGPLPLGWTHLITSPALSGVSAHLASRSQPTWARGSSGPERGPGRMQELMGAVRLMGQVYTLNQQPPGSRKVLGKPHHCEKRPSSVPRASSLLWCVAGGLGRLPTNIVCHGVEAVQALETGNSGQAPHPPPTAAPHTGPVAAPHTGPVAAEVGAVRTAVPADVTHSAVTRGAGVQSPGDRPPTGRHSAAGSVVAAQQGPTGAAAPQACVTGPRGSSASPRGRQASAAGTPQSGRETVPPRLAEVTIPQ
ncbi:MAG: hypothetical protein WDW36_008178 [Sanguina aurantia]